MQISDSSRKSIVDEFEYVVGQMRAHKEPSQKLYFFSATYGAIQRLLNSEYDPTLQLVHMILQGAYNSVNARYAALGQGVEMGIVLPHNLFEKLEETTEALGKAIDKNSGITNVLERLAVLTYSTTGNGYYLYQKGILKI
ncbi:hypothetical protein ES703_110203 [subsurface metagenome]